MGLLLGDVTFAVDAMLFAVTSLRVIQSAILEFQLRMLNLSHFSNCVGRIQYFPDTSDKIYALTLFISLRVVDAMLPITVKHAVILKLELVNTQVFHL